MDVLGPLLIGTWLNSLLYMLELREVYTFYYKRRFLSVRINGLFMRCLVAMMLLVDTAGTVGVNASVYKHCVDHWGDTEYVLATDWPEELFASTTGVSGFICQLYLIRRFAVMSKRILRPILLALGSLVSLAASLTVSVMLHGPIEVRMRILPVVRLWLIGSAAIDILIAVALVWELQCYKAFLRNFKTPSHDLIKRLIHLSIQTGAVTSTLALAVVIIFGISPHGNTSASISYCLGRVYGCTLLFNLNYHIGASKEPSNTSNVLSSVFFATAPRRSFSVVQLNNDIPTNHNAAIDIRSSLLSPFENVSCTDIQELTPVQTHTKGRLLKDSKSPGLAAIGSTEDLPVSHKRPTQILFATPSFVV